MSEEPVPDAFDRLIERLRTQRGSGGILRDLDTHAMPLGDGVLVHTEFDVWVPDP